MSPRGKPSAAVRLQSKSPAVSAFRVKSERFGTKRLTPADPVLLTLLKKAVRK